MHCNCEDRSFFRHRRVLPQFKLWPTDYRSCLSNEHSTCTYISSTCRCIRARDTRDIKRPILAIGCSYSDQRDMAPQFGTQHGLRDQRDLIPTMVPTLSRAHSASRCASQARAYPIVHVRWHRQFQDVSSCQSHAHIPAFIHIPLLRWSRRLSFPDQQYCRNLHSWLCFGVLLRLCGVDGVTEPIPQLPL